MEIQTNLFVDIKISPDYIDGSVLWWGLLEYWKHLVDYDLLSFFRIWTFRCHAKHIGTNQ